MKRRVPKGLSVMLATYLPAVERDRCSFTSRGARVLSLGFSERTRTLSTRGHEDDIAAMALCRLIEIVTADGPPTPLSKRAVASAHVLARALAKPRTVRPKKREEPRWLGPCEADLCGTQADRRCGECMRRMCWAHSWRVENRFGPLCADCIRRLGLKRLS